eukprot:GHVS01077615.1.p1 GENE.GHVS01077615.1~~GHVS01077615.1.p1  ORF type:complete len:144 (+),score=24.02 GHVS01077615.1:241-672(+)
MLGKMNKEFDVVWDEIRQLATPQHMQAQLEKHMAKINSEQSLQYNRYEKAREQLKLPSYSKDSIILQSGVSCAIEKGECGVVFMKGTASLRMKICPSAAKMLREIADGSAHRICKLSCDDFFEAACVCQVLLAKDVIDVIVGT